MAASNPKISPITRRAHLIRYVRFYQSFLFYKIKYFEMLSAKLKSTCTLY